MQAEAPDFLVIDPRDGLVLRQRAEGDGPAAAWRAWSQDGGDNRLVLAVPQDARPAPGLVAAATDLAARGQGAARGAVCDVDGQVHHGGTRADVTRHAVALAGSLLVSARHAAGIAERLSGRDWDAYWSADLAAAVAELCEVIPTATVFCHRGMAAKTGAGLLPLARAGMTPFDPAAPSVIVYGAADASTMLYFDAFSRCHGVNLRFLHPSRPLADLGWLTAASAVIIPRHIEPHLASGLVGLLRRVGVPVYWFVDDDLTALAEDGFRGFGFYGGPDFAAGVGQFDGVIASTPQLADRLDTRLVNGVGHRVPIGIRPPRISPHWPAAQAEGDGIGLIGGSFRGAALRDELLPALQAAPRPLRVIASDNLRPFLGSLSVAWEPFEPDFLTFLHRWIRQAPAMIVHPPGKTSNLPNKSIATILVAHSLGAVPIVADEPAFAGWGTDQGVLRLEPGNWAKALRQAADRGMARDLRARLATALAPMHLAPPVADDLLCLIGQPRPVDPLLAQDRLNRALADPGFATLPRPYIDPRPKWRRIASTVKRRLLSF